MMISIWRLVFIEVFIAILVQEIVSQMTETASASPNLEILKNNQNLATLTKKYNMLEKKIETIYIVSTIDAIKSQQFENAEMLLNGLNKEETISFIVQRVYNKNIKNMYLLLEIAKNISAIDVKGKILANTWNEMISNSDFDAYKIIELLKTIETEIIKKSNYTQEMYPNVFSPKEDNNALDVLKAIAVEKFKSALVAGNYQSNSIVRDFSKTLSSYNITILKIAMQNAIDSVFNRLSISQLIANIYSIPNVEERLESLIYTFKKVKDSNDQNVTIILDLCRCMIRTKYSEELRKTINQMTFDTNQLIFPKMFHIRNSVESNYLYEDSSQSNVTVARSYNMLHLIDSNFEKQASWYIQKDVNNEENFFQNHNNITTYMFTTKFSNTDANDLSELKDSTIPEEKINGNLIHLQDIGKQHYLCISSSVIKNGGHSTFLLKSELFNANSEPCKWTAEACLWP